MEDAPTVIINNSSGGSGSWVGDLLPMAKPLIRALTVLVGVIALVAVIVALNILPLLAEIFEQLRNALEAGGIAGLLTWLFGLNPADEPPNLRDLTAQEASKLTAGNIWRNQPIALLYRFITGKQVFQFETTV